MEKSNNCSDLEMLALEIERNRLQMQIAWHSAEGLDAALQTSKQTLENAKSRKFARAKKSSVRSNRNVIGSVAFVDKG